MADLSVDSYKFSSAQRCICSSDVVPDNFSTVTKYFYSQVCQLPVGVQDANVCTNCNASTKKSDLTKAGKHFIYGITKHTLQIQKVARNLTVNLGKFSDIVHGKSYNDLDLDLGKHDFTCCINTISDLPPYSI